MADNPEMTRLLELAQAYKRTFKGPVARKVLEDLEGFCRMWKTTHVIGDPTGSAQLEGRRQVALRIREYMNADETRIRQALAQMEESIDD